VHRLQVTHVSGIEFQTQQWLTLPPSPFTLTQVFLLLSLSLLNASGREQFSMAKIFA